MDDRRGIKSIETGGRLLEALATASGPSDLRTLAAEAGMSTSLAHAYLTSFSRLELVSQDALSKRYALGEFAVELGLSELTTLDPTGLALEVAAELRLALGQTIAVSVWGSHGPTVIRVWSGVDPFHATLYEGATLPLLGSATGKAFCSFLPREVVVRALRREREYVPRWEDMTVDVRRRGISRILDKPVPGLISFSAPVFDHTGRMLLALTVTGRASSLGPSYVDPPARQLLAAAQSLSARLGASPTARTSGSACEVAQTE